jgi:hypothetical protein
MPQEKTSENAGIGFPTSTTIFCDGSAKKERNSLRA